MIVKRFIPTVSGMKYEIAPTAKIEPIPPKMLVKSALKKCPLFLKTKSIIIPATISGMYSFIFHHPFSLFLKDMRDVLQGFLFQI